MSDEEKIKAINEASLRRLVSKKGLASMNEDIEELARAMWSAYSKKAGGKTFDGKPLPTWEELGDDRQQFWFAAANTAIDVCISMCALSGTHGMRL